MPEKENEQLKDVFCDVIESLAFMFGDAVALDEIPDSLPAGLEASIGFKGPRNGTLVLAAPAEIADELAANILGIEQDQEQTEEHSHDALGELMNITLGKLLTEMDGDVPVYDLTPPQVRQLSGEEWDRIRQADGTVGFVVDDHPILLRLTAA